MERIAFHRPAWMRPAANDTVVSTTHEYYIRKPHVYRPGFCIEFPDGTEFSMVDLRELQYDQLSLPEDVRREVENRNKEFAETMVGLGGYIEAICISPDMDGYWRGLSYEDVEKQLVEYYITNHPHAY